MRPHTHICPVCGLDIMDDESWFCPEREGDHGEQRERCRGCIDEAIAWERSLSEAERERLVKDGLRGPLPPIYYR